MYHKTRPSLAPSHLNQCWLIVNCSLRNNVQWHINRNALVFFQENAFENIVWKMAAILYQPQCVRCGDSIDTHSGEIVKTVPPKYDNHNLFLKNHANIFIYKTMLTYIDCKTGRSLEVCRWCVDQKFFCHTYNFSHFAFQHMLKYMMNYGFMCCCSFSHLHDLCSQAVSWKVLRLSIHHMTHLKLLYISQAPIS